MDAPTVEEVRDRSELLAARIPAPETGSDPLQPWVDDAAALVASLTCRAIGSDAEGEEVPDGKISLAKRAVTLKAEQLVLALKGVRPRITSIGDARLAGFTAGPYSESYFSPDMAAKAKMLDPDPILAGILWSLATEDCRDDWIALWGGAPAPASSVTSFEYSQRPGGY